MRRTVLLISAAAFALSACSTPATDGTPTPTGGSGASPSAYGQTPGLEVPKVANPIDLTRFKQAPCNALTDAQAQEILGPKVESKERLDGAAGPACMWAPPVATRPTVDVIFSNLQDSGTASVYAAKGNTYKLVEPLEPIDGYPVTAYDTVDERASKGRCSVALGTSDTQTVGVSLEQSEANIGKKDPCAAAREAAIRVLTTIRGEN